ncbi:unnamed protein product [Prorocentrum cordatum]|uniref:Uncharacterized protein n=1 Tax=Prorocentrum cordatum TaxID=2364126 RepID=A0ABN9VRF7_9DINO|nr:unnamed protein product [Polarella glacialis]
MPKAEPRAPPPQDSEFWGGGGKRAQPLVEQAGVGGGGRGAGGRGRSRSSIRGGLEHRKTCVRRATLQRHSFRVHRKNIARSRAVCDSHRAVDEAWLKTSKASALAGGRWKNCSSCRRRLPPLTALTHQSAAQSRISRRRGGKAG